MEKEHKSASKRKEGRERMRPREQKARGTAENQPLLGPRTPQAGECGLDVRLCTTVSCLFIQHPGCQFRTPAPQQKSSLDGEASGRMSNF